MDLVLDIASSIEFWRQRYPGTRALRPPSSAKPTECAYSQIEIDRLAPSWVSDEFLAPTNGVFHSLAFEATRYRNRKTSCVHTWRGPIPEGSFYQLQPHVFVESPGFMFLHAATILNFTQLVAFGDELCGLYSFDKRSKRGFVMRDYSLTTTQKLAHFVKIAKGCRGSYNARMALQYLVDESSSPMETYDEMSLCLPYSRGGYHIEMPNMNYEVPLSPRAARIAKRRNCRLDMGYPNQKLDIEHHGKLDHLSDEDKESDFARVSGLKEMGYEVIELTHDQVNDLFALEYIIERIAKEHFHKRLRKDALGATSERLALRSDLSNWNRSYGRIR